MVRPRTVSFRFDLATDRIDLRSSGRPSWLLAGWPPVVRRCGGYSRRWRSFPFHGGDPRTYSAQGFRLALSQGPLGPSGGLDSEFLPGGCLLADRTGGLGYGDGDDTTVLADMQAGPGLGLQTATAVAGIMLLRGPDLRRDGWWMLGATIGVGVTAFNTSTFESGWGSGYLLQFGWSFYYAEVACLVGPALRLPDQPAPPRAVRRLSLAFWIVLVLLPALSCLLRDPGAMKGYSGP